MESFAKSLARSLENEAVRKFIKTEANKKFDGDFEFLYKESSKALIANEKFENLLAKEHKAINQLSKDADGVEFLHNISNEIPLLNIAVPANIEEWNTEEYTPLVAVIPSNFNDQTAGTIKAYDAKGTVTLLSIKDKPNVPVIVVGRNERVEYNSINQTYSQKSYAGTSGKATNYILPDDPYSGGGGGGTTTNYCRQNLKTDYITGIYFSDLSYYEAWALGQPEIVYQVKNPNNDSFWAMGNVNDNRSDFDYWYNMNANSNYWDTNTMPNTASYFWFEDDGGFETEHNVSVTFKLFGQSVTKSVKFKIKNDDDVMGHLAVVVGTCPSGESYTMGGGDGTFKFKLVSK